jgi:hypothetical protein
MGRLENAIEKYGEIAEFTKSQTKTKFGDLEENTIKTIYKRGIPVKTIKDIGKWDPSGTNKYLDWILSRKLTTPLTYKTLKEFVTFFHNSPSKFSKPDIYQYKNEQDILSDLSEYSNKLSRSEMKDLGAIVVDETPQYKIIIPTSHQAAKMYGSGTKWCITSEQPGAFINYTQTDQLYIVIIKDMSMIRLRDVKKYHKIAILMPYNVIRGELIYNALDQTITRKDLKCLFPIKFLDICRKHFGNNHYKRDLIERSRKLREDLRFTMIAKKIKPNVDNLAMMDKIIQNLIES